MFLLLRQQPLAALVSVNGHDRMVSSASFDALGGGELVALGKSLCGSSRGAESFAHFEARDAAEARSLYEDVLKLWTQRPVDGLDSRLDYDGSTVASASAAMKALEEARRWARHRGWPLFVSDEDYIEESIMNAFNERGELVDGASERLRLARRAAEVARASLADDVSAFDDRLFEIETNVFVSAVPRSSTSKPKHVSRSGKTAYVEPKSVEKARLALEKAERDASEAEREVLAMLKERLLVVEPGLIKALDEAAHLDATSARCSLGFDHLDGVVPVVREDGVVDVRRLRHPLLSSTLTPSCEDSFTISPSTCAIVCGPNGAGKTTLLAAVGLVSIMTRRGIPVPAAAGARCDFFHETLADVDGSSKKAFPTSSTFEAHCRFAAHCVQQQRSSSLLVLIDEMGSGTDLEEGGAIAQASLEGLLETRKATVFAATHHPKLKELPAKDPHRYSLWTFRLGPDGFPTFSAKRASKPEGGHALDAARRCGLPTAILRRAESLLESESAHSSKEGMMMETRGANEAEARSLSAASRAAEREREALVAEREALASERDQWKKTVRDAAGSAERKAKAAFERLEGRERQLEALFQDLKSRPKLVPLEIVGTTIKEARIARKAGLRDKKEAVLAANGLEPLKSPPNAGDSVILVAFDAGADNLSTTQATALQQQQQHRKSNKVLVKIGQNAVAVSFHDLATWSVY